MSANASSSTQPSADSYKTAEEYPASTISDLGGHTYPRLICTWNDPEVLKAMSLDMPIVKFPAKLEEVKKAKKEFQEEREHIERAKKERAEKERVERLKREQEEHAHVRNTMPAAGEGDGTYETPRVKQLAEGKKGKGVTKFRFNGVEVPSPDAFWKHARSSPSKG
ncbi:hypothetical protein Moror_8476 [Moniliophthora roreri MCA 2997]|uniref:Uncharacterized protein n=1 Tax=Moniliophthora roreri (strain MCA 2997) TaxID=1381753 RepID=V2XP70_MONRO|nr:hypothetical protein Moror_8476 [Moniliophthora roreri MCA 2997]